MRKVNSVFYMFIVSLLTCSFNANAQKLRPTQEEVLVTFIVTDYNKIPEASSEVVITPDSGEKITATTGEDGTIDALIKKGAKCTMLVKKFGKEFLFDDQLKIVDQPGYFALDHTLKIRLITKYVRLYVLEGVNFDTNKWDLRDDATKPLQLLLKAMLKNPKMKIELAGHTDNVGNDDANMLLSQRRASSVRQFLIDNSISADRVIAKGYGESVPVATNDTEEGRQKNRRTEVRVIEE